MALAHIVHRIEVRETGRADLQAVRFVCAIGDQIDAKLALRRFDCSVGFARRHVEAFGVEFEVMDQRLHRVLHLGAARRRELRVLRHYRTRRFTQQLAALFDDLRGLVHLLHTAEIAIIAIAVLADRNFEIEFAVNFVRLRAAQIPGHAGAAHHHTRETPLQRVFLADDADIDVALLEDAVAGEQAFDVSYFRRKLIGPGVDIFDERRRQILVDTAWAHIVGVHARARGALIEHHQLFALFKTPERWRQRANVHGLRRHVEQMVQNAADFGIEHANDRSAARHLNARELFDRQTERVLLVHRRDVVEPVEIRDRLQIGFVLDQLLGAAMQQTDMRIDALNDFAVKLQHEAQHAVRGRVLRAEIDRERALFFRRRVGEIVSHWPCHHPAGSCLPTERENRSCGTPA